MRERAQAAIGRTDASAGVAAQTWAVRARASHQIRQCRDERGIGVLRRDTEIARHTEPFRQRAIVDVELHQRLGMLRDERDRHHQHRDAVMRGTLDLRLGARPDPALRRRARLVADHPVRPPAPHAASTRATVCSICHWYGSPRLHDRLPAAHARRTARAIRSPDRAAARAAAMRLRSKRGGGGDVARIGRVAAERRGVCHQARRAPPPRATRSASCRSSWWNTADTAAAARPRPASSRAPPARSRR